jgi:hypothetical protein
VAVARKFVEPDPSVSCVSCPTCSCEIPMLNAMRLPREFSVLCPNCGWRDEYQLVAVHDARQDGESTHEFRRIQFGKKNVKKSVKKNMPIQPKSRLNEWASWLLQ